MKNSGTLYLMRKPLIDSCFARRAGIHVADPDNIRMSYDDNDCSGNLKCQ